MTFVMMYNTKVKSGMEAQLSELRAEFKSIYEEHGVKVVGQWVCASNPRETLYMTQFESEEDYNSKIAALHENERYLKLSAQLNAIRVEFRATRLISH